MESTSVIVFVPGNSASFDRIARVGHEWNGEVPDAPTVALVLHGFPTEASLVNARRIYFSKALRRGVRVVLLAGPQSQIALKSSLGHWLTTTLSLSVWFSGPHEIRATDKSLDDFLSDQLSYVKLSPDDSSASVWGVAVNAEGDVMGPACFHFEAGSSEVILVPLADEVGAESQLARFLDVVPPTTEYPAYLDKVAIHNEQALRHRKTELHTELEDLEEKLEYLRRLKRILYLTGLTLQTEVVSFLNNELGVSTREVQGFGEDFRLFDADTRQDWAIGEVKSHRNSNVSKSDVAALVVHRKDADLPDEFPGLLVSNTFHSRHDIEARDEPVHPAVAHRAAEDNILVVRTLDLFRLKKLVLGGVSKVDQFVKAINDGGWLEVNKNRGLLLHSGQT